MIIKKYLLILIFLFPPFFLLAEDCGAFVFATFLGKWECDFQKTYEENLKLRQMPHAQREELKIRNKGRKIEIFANGEIIETFRKYLEFEKLISERVKCKIIKSSPTELLLEFIYKYGIRMQFLINYKSEEYISIITLFPPENADNKIKYFFKKSIQSVHKY